MNRDDIHSYTDAFLGLTPEPELARPALVREVTQNSELVELLREWLWLYDLQTGIALRLKIWFQLTYRELGLVFALSAREIGQLIRAQRSQLLPPYRGNEEGAAEAPSGFSCFMVEQHFSPWLDQEIFEDKVIESLRLHLDLCAECRSRLEEYRELEGRFIKARPVQRAFTEEEWNESLFEMQDAKRKQWTRFWLLVIAILTLSAFLAWVIWSKPEKMPNVYEIG